jgi:hypothetical protein
LKEQHEQQEDQRSYSHPIFNCRSIGHVHRLQITQQYANDEKFFDLARQQYAE